MLKDITKEQIDELAELIADGEMSARDIAKSQKLHMQSFNALIIEHLFAKESNKIKDAFQKRLLGNTITAFAVRQLEQPRVEKQIKAVTIHSLPKNEEKALKKSEKGVSILENLSSDGCVVKLEVIEKTSPPDEKILLQLLKMVDVQGVQKIAITPFRRRIPTFHPFRRRKYRK